MSPVTFRLSAEELARIDGLAERLSKKTHMRVVRSHVVRWALSEESLNAVEKTFK